MKFSYKSILLAAAVVPCIAFGNPKALVATGTGVRAAVVESQSIGAWTVSAMQIKNACRLVVFPAPVDDNAVKKTTAQIAATKKLEKICEGFTPADYSSQIDRDVQKRAVAASDQQWVAVSAFLNGNKSPAQMEQHQRSEFFSRLFALHDPDVFDEIGFRPFLYKGEAGPQIFFEGKKYPVKGNSEIFYAFDLLACQFGNKCDATDLKVIAECAGQGSCFDNRRQLVEASVRNAGGSMQKTEAFAKAMAQYISAGDYTKFLSP